MVIVIAIVIAVALDPAVHWLEQRGLPRGVGAFIVVLLLTAAWRGDARRELGHDSEPGTVDRATAVRVCRSGACVVSIARKDDAGVGWRQRGRLGQYALGVVRSASSALGMIVLALVLTVYLLIEWKRTLEWLIAFVPERHRPKTRRNARRSAGDHLSLRCGKRHRVDHYRRDHLCGAGSPEGPGGAGAGARLRVAELHSDHRVSSCRRRSPWFWLRLCRSTC